MAYVKADIDPQAHKALKHEAVDSEATLEEVAARVIENWADDE